MINADYLKEIINRRTVAICLQGKSIEGLENRISKFKNFDICWTSLGVFDIIDTYILSQINKTLDIVFDCATVPNARIPHYEKYIRFPRLKKFLNRDQKNLWITSHGVIRDSIEPLEPEFDLPLYEDKILQVDDLFPKNNTATYMDVPNSFTLDIGAMLAGGAKEIIVFGLDGYLGDVAKGLEFYYKPNDIAIERQAALGTTQDPGINRDSETFEERFVTKWIQYKKCFNNYCLILNCSPGSIYNIPPNHTYNNIIKHLKE